MLERAPYAIMAKDRYGCTNHKKHMPIDGLNGACCSNQKTIPCKNLEDWGLSCLPAAFFGKGLFSDVAGQARQNLAASVRSDPTSASAFPKMEGCRTGRASNHPADQRSHDRGPGSRHGRIKRQRRIAPALQPLEPYGKPVPYGIPLTDTSCRQESGRERSGFFRHPCRDIIHQAGRKAVIGF